MNGKKNLDETLKTRKCVNRLKINFTFWREEREVLLLPK